MTIFGKIIGVDESGKGDFFGPLVIASFLAGTKDYPRLKELGVRDGKLISENRLMDIDLVLRENYPHVLVIIDPPQYNRRYKQIKNLNKLLAWGHAESIEKLAAKYQADKAISDKFGKDELIEDELTRRKVSLEVEQIIRGESTVPVAAASIIARAAFIREMEKLSEEYGVEIPRGASSLVDSAGRDMVKKFGIDILEKVAKIHFKNFNKVVNPDLFIK